MAGFILDLDLDIHESFDNDHLSDPGLVPQTAFKAWTHLRRELGERSFGDLTKVCNLDERDLFNKNYYRFDLIFG